MPGFALLPTLDDPTSRLTFRLTTEEMKERNDWIIGADKYGLSAEEIAYEVGLKVQRVKQILKPSKVKRSTVLRKKFKTPHDAAVFDFWTNRAHKACAIGDSYGACNDCFGLSMILESEYDENGWPYDWAMHGQEEFIAAAS